MRSKTLVLAAAFLAFVWIFSGFGGGFAVASGSSSGASVVGGGAADSAEYVPGELNVKFKESVSTHQKMKLFATDNLSVVYESVPLRLKTVKIPAGASVLEVAKKLAANPMVEYAEPNYIDHINMTPNDPLYPNQWNMHGFSEGGIDAQTAWDTTEGDPNLVVAVVDTGVAFENYGSYSQAPDLANTSFVFPRNVVAGDDHPDDNVGHGTHVTGTIAQSTNNGIGVAGVAHGCKIMPVRVADAGGSISHANMAAGFAWAVDHGAKVINYSAGGSASQTKLDGCKYAYDHSVTICASAGNSATYNDTNGYPANYDQYCICVGATNHSKGLAYYSDYGSHQKVVAPGGDTSSSAADGILQQTYNTESDPSSGFGYVDWMGTSMACPHVSATAALFISKSGISDPDAVREQLERTAHDLGTAGRDDYFGYGLIDAYSALTVPFISGITPASAAIGEVVTIKGTSFGSSRGSSAVRFNGVAAAAAAYSQWSDTRIKVAVPPGATSGPVTVTTGAGTSNRVAFTVTPSWFLAEGSTAWGFDTYISIENADSTAVDAAITYMTASGKVAGPTVHLPAKSQARVFPRQTLGEKDFSTRVDYPQGKKVAVDRTMFWSSGSAGGSGYHSSIGVSEPAARWYLPEGSSDWGFDCWLLVQNPNATAADCTITYMIEGASTITRHKTIPANSRQSFNMKDDIGVHDASIMVESSNVPIIPERAMYKNGAGAWASGRREGHDSVGTTTPAKDYYLAEGTTDWGFTTYVLVQNPNNTRVTVTLTYNTGSGPITDQPFTMEPRSRKTVRVNDLHPGKDLSTHVHADKPIVAERSMYWTPVAGAGEAMHDSIGMSTAHTRFYLPDGETGSGTENFTLVQNPDNSNVQVRITYLKPSGAGNVSWVETIPAGSRKTFNMADRLSNTRAAVMVECLTAGKKIICERAMYFQNRWGGTDTIGGYSQ